MYSYTCLLLGHIYISTMFYFIYRTIWILSTFVMELKGDNKEFILQLATIILSAIMIILILKFKIDIIPFNQSVID